MKKILYYFLGFLLVLLLAYIGLCAIGTKNFNTERSLVIDAPKNMLFNMVDDLKTWQKWSPWMEKDPNMKMTFGDKTVGVGAKYAWEGNKDVGKGTMTVVESIQGSKHKSTMLFDGFDDPSTAEFNFNDVDGKTEVVWKHYADEDLPFLIRGMMFITGAKKMMEKDFENGLKNMESLAIERKTNKMYGAYKIIEATATEKHFVMNRQEVPFSNTQQFYAANLGGLFGKVQRAGVEMDGMPCGLFYKFDYDKEVSDMAAAIPVKEAIAIQGAQSLTLPESKIVQVQYYGDYTGTQAAHDAIQSYMKDYGILHNPPFIEEYVTDPGEEPDPKKWLTKITYYFDE